jgi:hypothetical protein
MKESLELTGTKTIFRKEFDGKAKYSIVFSKKNEDETWTNFYMPVNFKKGVELTDKTLITIKKAWLNPYKAQPKNGISLFVSEFETVSEDLPVGFEEIDIDDIPFG